MSLQSAAAVHRGWKVACLAGVLLAAGCATNLPATPLPTPALTPSPTPNASPSPRPTPPPTLHAGGMATVVSGPFAGLSGSEVPSSGRPLLGAGDVVYIADGPQAHGGVQNWLLTTENGRGVAGWFPEVDSEGDPSLSPFNPACPDPTSTLTLDDLRTLGRLQSLSCFGSRYITLEGPVECYEGHEDGGLGGTAFTGASRFCELGEMGEGFSILGSAMTDFLATPGASYPFGGTFRIVGHFDDPASAACGFYHFGTSVLEFVGDPMPVMECRRQFVATSVTRLDQ